MDLRGWNQRLTEHFSALARARKNTPIFALEHGLATAEVLDLSKRLRTHIRTSRPLPEHTLSWVVYSAEIGYGYVGEEYWQTFEDTTPGWTERGDREWIRDAFAYFCKRYSGAKPSGPWAKQFSIISWPITHAILPQDLQQQLAWVLYELRHSFSAELFDSPLLLGEFIAARSWKTSSRFQNLVQEPALVGQIATALLLQTDEETATTLLHPMTLKRIGADLARESRGRDWLRRARRAAEERVRFRGLAHRRPINYGSLVQQQKEARAEAEQLGIEPRLVLRPTDRLKWEVLLEIPDLSHLLLRFPQFRHVLAESRCTVAGAAGRPLARGSCLDRRQRVALSRWPRTDEVLLMFDRTEPQLEFLLRTECLLRPSTAWLFRIASDGLAYESRGMRVRAGSRYLLVRDKPFGSLDVTHQVELVCEGMHAIMLDLPAALSPEWSQVLQRLHLTQLKSIEVWPAGLAAVTWDGDGHGEWFASETPTLAICSDHTIGELTIAMGDGSQSLSLAMDDTGPGAPIFVELPPLPVGVHKLSVTARSGSGANSEVVGDLDLVMRVREPRAQSHDRSTQGLLAIETEPARPSLEQLWEGKASITVLGPAGRPVRCRISMYTRGLERPSLERQLPPMTLPLSTSEWAKHFDLHFKSQKDAPHAYDIASACEVEFSADELGAYTLRCEREFTPLRWSLRRGSISFIARLHDDSGRGLPIVERYSFERPTVAELLTADREVTSARGGLYVATSGDCKASIIVPPVVKDLAGLKCEPQIELGDEPGAEISRLLGSARLWKNARLSGELIAGVRQRVVLRSITMRIWSLLLGPAWARLEEEFARGELGVRFLRRAVPQPQANTAARLELLPAVDQIFPQEILKGLMNASLEERGTAFLDFVNRFKLAPRRAHTRVTASSPVREVRTQKSAWLSEFALRLASDPATIDSWAGRHLSEGIRDLRTAPTLARAARFFVLATDQQRQSSGTAAEPYGGWRWSQ